MSLFRGLLSSAPSRQSTGARLLERLVHSTQLEDRREAITEFNALTAAEPVRLIDKGGMSVLVQLLREEDTQLTRDVLETLSNLMDPEMPRGVAAETGEVKAVHNASVFLTHDVYMLDVLNSSEDGDLYVRYHAVQLVMNFSSGPALSPPLLLPFPIPWRSRKLLLPPTKLCPPSCLMKLPPSALKLLP